jgi:hypothetical protein
MPSRLDSGELGRDRRQDLAQDVGGGGEFLAGLLAASAAARSMPAMASLTCASSVGTGSRR